MSGIHGGGRKAVLTRPKDGDVDRELFLNEFDQVGNPTDIKLNVTATESGIQLPAEDSDKPLGGTPQSRIRQAVEASVLRVYDLLLPTDPKADDPPDEDLKRFAAALVGNDGMGGLGAVPAAYTYLCQIVAHDISHTRLSANGTISSLVPGSLDFDSLLWPLGAARQLPQDALAEGSVALGQTLLADHGLGTYDDLPRWPDGRPVIPDTRNDATLNLAQLHVLISKFIMAADRQLAHLDPARRRGVIVQHLQSVVYHDCLGRLLQQGVLSDIEKNGRKLVATAARGGTSLFYAPLEFSWGCFQIGHSMIRENYDPWGRSDVSPPPVSAHIRTLLNFTSGGNGLVQGRLRDNWRADWSGMLGRRGRAAPVMAAGFGAGLRRDVYSLPGRLFDVVAGQQNPDIMNMALRTMSVARRLGVPDGQALVAYAQGKGVAIDALSYCELVGGLPDEVRDALTLRADGCVSLAARTPLWFYSLREAELLGGGTRFGPLGSRIVGETIHAAIEASRSGFLDGQGKPAFPDTDALPAHYGGRFDLYDLRAIAEA